MLNSIHSVNQEDPELTKCCIKSKSNSLDDQTASSVCVVCCSMSSIPNDTILKVSKAMSRLANVRTVLLVENEITQPCGVEVLKVPISTKLSKIRHIRELYDAELFCICDPDLSVNEDACLEVLQKAMNSVRDQKDEVVVYGIVVGMDECTLLSRVVAFDKWLSHYIFRRFLWTFGIGITLPGQFLVLSRSLLCSIDSDVDSYLDDLCLGLAARLQKVKVYRVPVIIGEERSRCSWESLLIQRLRWMKGLNSLAAYYLLNPYAVALIGIHFTVYHFLPVIVMIAILTTILVQPVLGISIFFSLTIILSVFSRRSLIAISTYLITFPVIHVLATLMWWIPLSRTLLTKR